MIMCGTNDRSIVRPMTKVRSFDLFSVLWLDDKRSISATKYRNLHHVWKYGQHQDEIRTGKNLAKPKYRQGTKEVLVVAFKVINKSSSGWGSCGFCREWWIFRDFFLKRETVANVMIRIVLGHLWRAECIEWWACVLNIWGWVIMSKNKSNFSKTTNTYHWCHHCVDILYKVTKYGSFPQKIEMFMRHIHFLFTSWTEFKPDDYHGAKFKTFHALNAHLIESETQQQ